MSSFQLRTPETADDLAQPVLQTFKKQYGTIPNFYAGLAIDGATLCGYLSFEQHIEAHCLLTPEQREMISLAVANHNGCQYCVSGHTFSAKKMGFDQSACADIQQGIAQSPTDQLVLDVALEALRNQGRLSAETLNKCREAHFSDAMLLQIYAWVGINTFSNWINNLVEPKIDFPLVPLQNISSDHPRRDT
ncbi:carboxymuconolactone decarboxylase family protein [Paludibacterium purpuratum]|uniref:AhpD family alkylhydroperoxidase n=1 Tax=Paludibacterium purpuratum TaxID=1144873 RepID=A0A4R7B4V5_9NEIS|nr:carboxymuconolactone decarboxylase family protein [Paludibacterium purpuratum]TDR77883.1 AhpD family alkylhydroperoxidase [Paludibacterium purpuratum]